MIPDSVILALLAGAIIVLCLVWGHHAAGKAQRERLSIQEYRLWKRWKALDLQYPGQFPPFEDWKSNNQHPYH